MTTRILIIDDEAPIRDMVRFALQLADFTVLEADSVKAGMQKIQQDNPDLLLLDWMLPDGSGVKVIEKLRNSEQTRFLPVIMLTARAQEDNKVMGLKAGADDYIVKPFSPRELIARIETLLRRTTGQPQQGRLGKLQAGAITLDLDAQCVYLNGQWIKTGPIEYKLLHFLLSRSGKVFSRQQLLDHVWGNCYIGERTVDVHIRRLRKLLASGGCQDYIRTVRGSGYCFDTREQA